MAPTACLTACAGQPLGYARLLPRFGRMWWGRTRRPLRLARSTARTRRHSPLTPFHLVLDGTAFGDLRCVALDDGACIAYAQALNVKPAMLQ